MIISIMMTYLGEFLHCQKTNNHRESVTKEWCSFPESAFTNKCCRCEMMWVGVCVCVCVCVPTQSYLILWDPMNCSPPGSSVQGISQTRILEWVAISSSTWSSRPRDWSHISCIAGIFFTTEPQGKPHIPYKYVLKDKLKQLNFWRVYGIWANITLNWAINVYKRWLGVLPT